MESLGRDGGEVAGEEDHAGTGSEEARDVEEGVWMGLRGCVHMEEVDEERLLEGRVLALHGSQLRHQCRMLLRGWGRRRCDK